MVSMGSKNIGSDKTKKHARKARDEGGEAGLDKGAARK